MIQTKPLATRVDSLVVQPTRVMKGVPVSKGFSSFLGEENAAKTVNAAISMPVEGQAPRGRTGMAQAGAVATLARVLQESQTPLKTMNSLQAAQHGENPNSITSTAPRRPMGVEGAETAIRVAAHRKRTPPANRMAELVKMDSGLDKKIAATPGTDPESQDAGQIGSLAARFESGNESIAAIGYDRHGGTSYGKFQFSSRSGSVRNFVNFLKTEEPEWASRLEAAGAANTGNRRGRMPDVWRQLAYEAPERFEDLQDRFIHNSHFMPALDAISQKTGLAFDGMPSAFKEVLFSTAVQHGPSGAIRIVSRAVNSVDQDKLDPDRNTPETLKKTGELLIRRIYALRSQQFGSSTASVQSAVKNRLKEEMGVALAMLHKDDLNSVS